tara:strand:+ start:1709 stop:3088 length:1380 start_codon:yes stop_codon:yes gene_type:complete
MLTKKNYFTSRNLLNLLIAFIPLSIAIGNIAINANVVLICCVGLLTYKLRIFKLDQKIIQYLIYSFFLYLILITLINNLPNIKAIRYYEYTDILSFFFSLQWEHILKSFFFLRFLVFFLVLNYLIEEKNFRIKYFFISAAIMSLLISFSVFLNFISGTDIIFFGSEKISGGYIQRFSLFCLSIITFLSFNSNSYKKIFFFIFVIFFLFSIAFTYNKMPLIIYIFSVIFYIILLQKKKLKKIFFILFFVSSIFFVSVIKFFPGCVGEDAIKCKNLPDGHIVRIINSFVGNVSEILTVSPKLFYYGSLDKPITFASGYLVTFNSGIQTWKKNKVFGGGLKSFRLNCSQYYKNWTGTNYKYETCNTHPHNYAIEMLVDTGIVGLSIFYLIFIIVIFKFYTEWRKFSYKNYSTPFFLIIFFEFFPIRSTGSFFTTGNAILIFFLLAVVINVSKIEALSFKSKL